MVNLPYIRPGKQLQPALDIRSSRGVTSVLLASGSRLYVWYVILKKALSILKNEENEKDNILDQGGNFALFSPNETQQQ